MNRFFCLAGFLLAAQLAQAQAPALKAGDAWKIQSVDTSVQPHRLLWSESQAVVAVGDKETVRVNETNTGEKYVAVHDAATDKRLATYKYDDAAPDHKGKLIRDWSKNDALVQFPLEIGKQWEVHESQRVVNDLKAEVLALEKVKTPAGEFEAYKISLKGWWRNTSNGRTGPHERTIWYAPSAKAVVKQVGATRLSNNMLSDQWEVELLEYKAAP